jgi:hypothetical protein
VRRHASIVWCFVLSQGVLLRGADVYQPEGLAAKLMDASTLLGDADVGANLAALLASDAGRRMSWSGSRGLNDDGQDNALAGLGTRTSWNLSDASRSPKNTGCPTWHASPVRLGKLSYVCGVASQGSDSLPSYTVGQCPTSHELDSLERDTSLLSTACKSYYFIAPVMDPSEKLLAGVGSRDFNVLELDMATQVPYLSFLQPCCL